MIVTDVGWFTHAMLLTGFKWFSHGFKWHSCLLVVKRFLKFLTSFLALNDSDFGKIKIL